MIDNEDKILADKINYLRSQLERAYQQEKDFNHPDVYKWSVELDKLITQYQKILASKRIQTVLSEDYKKRILEISNPKILEEEIQAMKQTLRNEYCGYSLRLELAEKIKFIKGRLPQLNEN